MELLGEASQRRFVTEVLQLGLFHGVRRHWTERACQILLGDRIGGKCWSRVRIQYFPGRRPNYTLGRETLIALENYNGLLEIGAVFAIDFAAGKMRAVEQDLRSHHRGTLRVRADRLVHLCVIDEVRLQCFLFTMRNVAFPRPLTSPSAGAQSSAVNVRSAIFANDLWHISFTLR
jgi:hypothetical protein